MRIAVLDNDADRADLVQTSLLAAGHHCRHFESGEPLLEQLQRDGFDLLIMDWQTANEDATRILHMTRKQVLPGMPVLFLTGRSSENDIACALEAGADDYIIKPVRRGELLTRVQVLLKRAYPELQRGEQLHFGQYGFETAESRATVAGKPIDLTQKEFELALLLFRNLDRPLSRTYIREAIWPREHDVPSRTMDTHVSRVRSKLGLRPENGFRLAPVYSYGYRLEQIP